MLLHSCPDTVRKFPLRETQTSTSLTTGGSESDAPRHIITPAVADCRYRAPLSPRLHGTISILVLHWNVNQNQFPGRETTRFSQPQTKRRESQKRFPSVDFHIIRFPYGSISFTPTKEYPDPSLMTKHHLLIFLPSASPAITAASFKS